MAKTIWITEKEFGTVRTIRHHGKKIQYRVPTILGDSVTLRFKGLGQTQNDQAENLMLQIRVDRGKDRHGTLWISETEARTGCLKTIGYENKGPWFWPKKQPIQVPIPGPGVDGSVLRIPGKGQMSDYQWGWPWTEHPLGNLLVKVRVFPDRVKPVYRHVDALSTENLALEGWVYRQKDEILQAVRGIAALQPVGASTIADIFNSGGWQAIADFLVHHLRVRHFGIRFECVSDLPVPGQCNKRSETKQGINSIRFLIKVRTEFIDDPFSATAILAHEICHVIEDQYLSRRGRDCTLPKGAGLTELERRVDLLVFMHQLGEFQLRVARQSNKTFGYFNQEIFERMYVILQNKKNA